MIVGSCLSGRCLCQRRVGTDMTVAPDAMAVHCPGRLARPLRLDDVTFPKLICNCSKLTRESEAQTSLRIHQTPGRESRQCSGTTTAELGDLQPDATCADAQRAVGIESFHGPRERGDWVHNPHRLNTKMELVGAERVRREREAERERKRKRKRRRRLGIDNPNLQLCWDGVHAPHQLT